MGNGWLMGALSRRRTDSPAPVSPPPAATAADAITAAAAAEQESVRETVASFLDAEGLVAWSGGESSGPPRSAMHRFVALLPEARLRSVSGFAAERGHAPLARLMLATALGSMASRYRARRSLDGVDWTLTENLVLLGDEFIRTCPPETLEPALGGQPSSSGVRALIHRFEVLCGALRPQHFHETPVFSTLPEGSLLRARAGLVVANALYSPGVGASGRHRESELLDAVERHFERRFEVWELLRRMPIASPSDIDEAMGIETAPLLEGFL